MSLLDVYSDELKAASLNERPKPKPTAKASAWSLPSGEAGPKPMVDYRNIERGVAAGSAESFGMMGDVLGAFGQAFATTAPATPMFGTDPYEEQTEAARQKMTTQGIDMSSEAGDLFRGVARSYRPDPLTAGLADRMMFDLSRVLTKAIGSSVVLGPVAGGAATGVNEGMQVSDDLKQQGVDLNTRTAVGAVQGVATGLGVALPVAGQTLAQTAGLVALGGPASFIGAAAASREILKRADYGQISEQYDPFDPVGLAVSTLLPAAFGGYALRNARVKAAAKADADFMAGPIPSELSPIASAIDAYKPSPDDIAAARVALQVSERQSSNPGDPTSMRAMDQHEEALTRAEEQIARGEPVQVADVAPAELAVAEAPIETFVSDLRAGLDAMKREIDAASPTRTDAATTEATPAEASAQGSGADSTATGVPGARGAADEAGRLTVDPWEQRQKRDPATLLTAALRADELRAMASAAYWTQEGGKILRSGADDFGDGGMGGSVVGRTTWIPAEEWFGRMRAELGRAGLSNQSDIQVAIDKAIAGEKLKAIEARTVEWMRIEAEDVRDQYRAAEFAPNDADMLALDAQRVGLSGADAGDASLVARAAEIDPDGVERAALQYENDDAGFMSAIRGILDGNREQAAANARASIGEGGDGTRQAESASPREAGQQGEQSAGLTFEQAAMSARLADITQRYPDLSVRMDGMDAPMLLADFLDTVKKEADAERADAPDFMVAAECFLLNGG